MVSLAFELGFTIALPLLIFSQIGKFFDARWHTTPLFTLVGIFLAMISTGIWLYRRLKPYLK